MHAVGEPVPDWDRATQTASAPTSAQEHNDHVALIQTLRALENDLDNPITVQQQHQPRPERARSIAFSTRWRDEARNGQANLQVGVDGYLAFQQQAGQAQAAQA